jgi:hypothetical protein
MSFGANTFRCPLKIRIAAGSSVYVLISKISAAKGKLRFAALDPRIWKM